LRAVAENSQGVFPETIGLNKGCMASIKAIIMRELDKIVTKYGKEAPEVREAAVPLGQKYMQGVVFYMSLKPENDPHYLGGGVKLGTPDRPILWYKPTGAEKYRVIYADLSVKEMGADEVKKLPASGIKK
jgi:hypothetical protein